MRKDSQGRIWLNQKELLAEYKKDPDSKMTAKRLRLIIKRHRGAHIKFRFMARPGQLVEFFYDLSQPLAFVKTLMKKCLAGAEQDFKSGARSPYIISRDLINGYHQLRKTRPDLDDTDFESWFRKEHDALGKKIADAQMPKVK